HTNPIFFVLTATKNIAQRNSGPHKKQKPGIFLKGKVFGEDDLQKLALLPSHSVPVFCRTRCNNDSCSWNIINSICFDQVCDLCNAGIVSKQHDTLDMSG